MFLVTSEGFAAVAGLVLAPLAGAVGDWLAMGDMGFLLAVNFVRDQDVDVTLRIAVSVNGGDHSGIQHPSVGELHHLIRLVLNVGTTVACEGVHWHHLASHHLSHLGGRGGRGEVKGVVAVGNAIRPGPAGIGDPGVGAKDGLCRWR